MPVRIEYSVVKMVSRGVSANWPMKAKFTAPSGTTFGRSDSLRGWKNALIYGMKQVVVLHFSCASVSILSSGTPI